MSNPLVAQAQSQTTAVTGIGLAESAVDLANGVSDGSWVEAGLGGIGVGLEVLSMVIDPVGTLLSYGVSWLIEHVEPLKEALDWFAGDPPVIQSFSDTWANVAAEVGAIAEDYAGEVRGGTSGWTGAGSDAYRQAAAERADAVSAASTLADGISGGVMVMGMVVAAVREIVRDIVAELVGKLITWALEAAATLGLGTPVIVTQAITAITKVTNRIADLVRKLIKTIGNVSPRISKIVNKLDEIIQKLAGLGRKADAPTTPSGATTPSGVISPDVPNSPNTPTTPSSTTPDAPGSPSGSTTPNGSTSPSGSTSPNSSSRPDNPDTTRTPEQNRVCRNDPVDVASGEVVVTQTDVELAGVLPLILRRVHVSSYRVGRSFGRSWACTLDQRLELDPLGVVFVADDGVRLVYPLPSTGSQVLPAVGPQWPLERTSDGLTITVRESGQMLHFPGEGAVRPVAAISDRNGNRIDFDRDADGMVRTVQHSGGYRLAVNSAQGRVRAIRMANPAAPEVTLLRFGYSAAGDLAEVINASGQPLRFEYDEAGRISSWTDRNRLWYRYLYDEHGRCVANQGSGGALNGTFSYDSQARTTRFTDAMGHSSVYQLDERGNVVAETNALGETVAHQRDERDRLLSTTDPTGRVRRYQYDELGNVTEQIGPDGTRTRAEYDDLGNPTKVVEPDGGIWRREFDERGNLLSVTDPAGAATRYEYADHGGLTRVIDALGQVREIETDATGLPLAVRSPGGELTTYRRDTFGRITEIVDPVGGISVFSWTVEGRPLSRRYADGSAESWRYDGEGNEVEHRDVLGRVSRIERTHFDKPAVLTGPDGARTEYTYDQNMQVVAIADAAGRRWTFDWDPGGRLSREVDVHGREIRYRYDPSGRLAERVNAAGETTCYAYDAAGNRTLIEAADIRAEFEYDSMGRIIRARNGDADVTFERDALGRVRREVVDGHLLESSYDALGRRLRRVTPTGAVSEWEYDGSGHAIRLRTGGHDTAFRFDQAGREVERLLDTGTTLAQTWDAGHRLTAQTVSVAGVGQGVVDVVQHREHRYRMDGRPVETTDRIGGSRRFELDPVGRVLGATGPSGREHYEYDAAGMVADVPVRYRRDRQGRIVLRQRKRLSAKPATWHYRWNCEDRLVEAVTPDGSTWRYRYDALGRRVAKERLAADGSVAESVRFHWDGVNLAEQVRSGGTATTWTFAPDSVRPITQAERVRSAESDQEWVDSEFYSIVTDLIGTPTELVDAHGAVAWRRQETVWGMALGDLAARAQTPLRFPGQYDDPEIGLRYNFHRYYDPAIGQYASADPLGSAAGPDPYAYAPNPATGSDPFGLALCEAGATKAIDDYRAQAHPTIRKRSNVALAEYEINGQSGQQFGVSGTKGPEGSSPMPSEYTLDRGPEGIARNADSEMKILEDIKSRLSPDASGRVHIWSERPVCPSCQHVMDDFRRSFPNIEVTFSDLGRG